MGANRLKQTRQKAGLSQAGLGAVVGTSQQQIQRIEAGQTVRLDLALRIVAALGTSPEEVFPDAAKLIRRATKGDASAAGSESARKIERELASAGVDADPAQWTLKLRLRGGAALRYHISSADVDRLSTNLANGGPDETPFMVVEAEEAVIAVNMKHVLHAHTLFDAPFVNIEKEPDEDRCLVSAYLSDSAEPLVFGAEPDFPSSEDDNELGEFRALLYDLETSVEEKEHISFLDEDGERAFFRAADIALFEVSHTLLIGFSDDGDDDLDEPADERPSPNDSE